MAHFRRSRVSSTATAEAGCRGINILSFRQHKDNVFVSNPFLFQFTLSPFREISILLCGIQPYLTARHSLPFSSLLNQPSYSLSSSSSSHSAIHPIAPLSSCSRRSASPAQSVSPTTVALIAVTSARRTTPSTHPPYPQQAVSSPLPPSTAP